MIAELKNLTPDFVLLQQVSHKDAQHVAELLEMRHKGQLQLYYSPTNPGTRDAPGNAILARHAIFQGRTISNGGPTDAGIWVEPVVAGNRFYLADVDLTPPPLAAPAAKLRADSINSLIASFTNAPAPCIIGGTIPAALEKPPGLLPDVVVHDPPLARVLLLRGWHPPTTVVGAVDRGFHS